MECGKDNAGPVLIVGQLKNKLCFAPHVYRPGRNTLIGANYSNNHIKQF
jgi:hypothetical protein